MVAVISGAGGGIGAATAHTLARTGRTVVALDRDDRSVHEVVARLRAEGLRAEGHPVDVSGAARVEKILDGLEAAHGPVTELVHVPGAPRPGTALETSDEDWAAAFTARTTGVFVLSRAVARRMVPLGRGSIVTVTSGADGVPRAGMAACAAAEAAAAHFTRCLGLELAPHGIRCDVVSPGSADAPAQPSGVADAVLLLLPGRERRTTTHDLYADGSASLRA